MSIVMLTDKMRNVKLLPEIEGLTRALKACILLS